MREKMTNTCNKCICNKVCNHDLFGFENCGNFMPAEDVVEVVRCKDCIHRDKAGLCQAEWQKLTIVKDNHFCGKGERKDGNDNG